MGDSAQARYEMASQYAAAIRVKAEELSTAIYEASKMGYAVKLRLENVINLGDFRFVGTGEHAANVRATVAFDIGERGL